MQNKRIIVSLVKLRRIVLPYIGVILFSLLGFYAYGAAPSADIGFVLCVLVLTTYLFLFEIVSVDVTALAIMVLLGLTSWQFEWFNLSHAPVDEDILFSGFSSNAVLSIIGVMIIGAGLDRSGIMTKLAQLILKAGGQTENRITVLLSSVAGGISAFIQNVGVAALFLPVINRITAKTEITTSRLLLPMGFAVICGGTITMIGSSPLIILNDLIHTSNRLLPVSEKISDFSLFSVAPIGIALVCVCILYFIFFAHRFLPKGGARRVSSRGTMDYIRKIYGVNFSLHEIHVPSDSKIEKKSIGDIENEYAVRVVAMKINNQIRFAPSDLSRESIIEKDSTLAVMASDFALKRFTDANDLRLMPVMSTFADTLSAARSGMSEIVIPPSSEIIGKTPREIWLRKTFGLSALGIYRDGVLITESISDEVLHSGDTLVCHSRWENLQRLESNRNFVIITDDYPKTLVEERSRKIIPALAFFMISLYLVIFTDMRLSLALFTGAVGMVLSGVISIEDAYKAVSWKSVFVLASLIPLGIAVETTGTAGWIATQTIHLLGDLPHWVYLLTVGILTTFFTLVMSNVGATVLLVPLAINIAHKIGADPSIYAITVGIVASNSFIIPTHQVNALIMGPGNYKAITFLKVGGMMTVLYLATTLIMVSLIF